MGGGGGNINDAEFREDGAKVQLALNADLAKLPDALRNLSDQFKDFTTIGTTLRLPKTIDEDIRCREAVRAAKHSLAFGVKTVNVAAVVKVVVNPKPSQKQIQAVLGVRASLPAALLARLASVAGVTHSAATAPISSACKRGNSSGSLSDPPGAKRLKAEARS